jgi:hypothetical protein
MREELLNRMQTAFKNRDSDSQKMLAKAMELYASTEARANDTIKQVEEFAVPVRAIEEQEQVVDELQHKL